MRKSIALLMVLLLTCGSLSCAAADRLEENNSETGYRAVIEDNAGLLQTEEFRNVFDAMKGVTVHCDAGFLTRQSGGGSVEEYARQWGRGTFGHDRYIVFFIDMGTRNICAYAGWDMLDVFSVADANTVTDNVYKWASRKQYGECAVQAFGQIAADLEGIELARPMKYVSNVLIGLCLSVMICFLIVSKTLKKHNITEATKITAMVAAGAGTTLLARKLVRTVHHESSSGGGGHGGHGGHGGGGGGHSGGGGGHHGF